MRRPALTVSPIEMLAADGYLLGTPANLGYISGALKHAFDQSYYQPDATRGRPFGLWLHGNEGTEGAQRAVDGITTGLAGRRRPNTLWSPASRTRPICTFSESGATSKACPMDCRPASPADHQIDGEVETVVPLARCQFVGVAHGIRKCLHGQRGQPAFEFVTVQHPSD